MKLLQEGISKLKLSFVTSLAVALINEEIDLSEYQDCLLINDVKIFGDEYYALLQEAYISTHPDFNIDCYRASAVTLTGINGGKRCEIHWEIIWDEETREQITDESEVCDWSNPSDVKFY